MRSIKKSPVLGFARNDAYIFLQHYTSSSSLEAYILRPEHVIQMPKSKVCLAQQQLQHINNETLIPRVSTKADNKECIYGSEFSPSV